MQPKISTYVNALAKTGFVIEQMVKQTDDATMQAEGNVSAKTKKCFLISVLFKVGNL